MKGKLGWFAVFVLLCLLLRLPGVLTQQLGSFSGVYALMFCAGVYLSGRTASWLPLSAVLVSDLLLNFIYGNGGWTVWKPKNLLYQGLIYVGYIVILLLGRRFKPKSSFSSLLGGGILGALIFYVFTNTVSWLVNPFGNKEYVHTFSGWLTALILGTHNGGSWPPPWQFFLNTLLSGGMFTALFVALMKSSAESPEEKEAPETAADSEPEAEAEPEEAKAS